MTVIDFLKLMYSALFFDLGHAMAQCKSSYNYYYYCANLYTVLYLETNSRTIYRSTAGKKANIIDTEGNFYRNIQVTRFTKSLVRFNVY